MSSKSYSGIVPRVPLEQQFNPLQVTFAEPKMTSGYLKVGLPQDIVDELRLKAEEARENETYHNSELAGNIKEEYLVDSSNFDSRFDLLLYDMCDAYEKNFRYMGDQYKPLNKPLPHELKEMWVNYQPKYEVNPPHTHSGIFAFVIWLQIPYDLEEEIKHLHRRHASLFGFLFPQGNRMTNEPLYVDKSWEGQMILFPSSQFHYVNPFYTSDDYRISMSGNICLDSTYDFKEESENK